jgi:hypothetical protein
LYFIARISENNAKSIAQFHAQPARLETASVCQQAAADRAKDKIGIAEKRKIFLDERRWDELY